LVDAALHRAAGEIPAVAGADPFLPQRASLSGTPWSISTSASARTRPAAAPLDTVPPEFDVVALEDGGICDSLLVVRATNTNGNSNQDHGGIEIACELSEQTDVTLASTFHTRQSPGKGHSAPIFAPASCGMLLLDDAAVAVDHSDPDVHAIAAGPTAALAVAINDLTLDLDGDGTGSSCDRFPDTPNADQANADGNGSGDVCQVMLLQ
jgi:hypothetical protein